MTSSLFRRFVHDRRANIVPLFAIAVVPIIGLVGAAVDYSRANSVKAAMQAAVDATALMLSKNANGMTGGQLAQFANDYFQAVFNRPGARDIQITPILTSPTNGSFQLNISGSGMVDTTFARVFGQTEMKVTVESQVVWGYRKLELALALDNTGSMSANGKMDALKAASHNLLTTLKNASKSAGSIKVSIVPFGRKVNVGSAYNNQDWFDWATYAVDKNTWTGCVIDRDQPNDVQDTKPDANITSTLFPAVVDCGSLTSLMPLTDDWVALNSKVDQMTPDGNTNVAVGLVWGWHTLTKGAPFTQGATPASDLDKVLIILTDGLNTENRWTTAPAQIDARTQQVCDNVKADGIQVYSIRVIDGNVGLLQSCASSPTMFYDVQQAGDLNGVFGAIADQLATLRISK